MRSTQRAVGRCKTARAIAELVPELPFKKGGRSRYRAQSGLFFRQPRETVNKSGTAKGSAFRL